MMKLKLTVYLMSLVGMLGATEGNVIEAGAGSYLTERPAPCKALPEAIYKTAEVAGATVTGQWWSSLVWQEFSQVMFAHPLAMRAMAGGLAVCYPGSNIVANHAGIFGGGFGEAGDLTIGHPGVESFARADCGGYPVWLVTAVFEAEGGRLETSFGHGSPFVFCKSSGDAGLVTFAERPVVWSGGEGDAVLGVTVKGRDYGLFGGVGSKWSGTGGVAFTNSGKGYFSVALLPERGGAVLADFAVRAHQHVVGTRVEYRVAGGFVETEYAFELEAMEGVKGDTVYALYPHQWKYVDGEVGGGRYGSVRGEMKVVVGSGFRTRVPVQGVLPMLPGEGIGERERMMGYLEAELEKEAPAFGDTYWEGKHLGKLATLSGTAEAAGAVVLRERFVAEIKRRLEAWFTAVEGKAEPVFYYDERWGTLVGSRPSYGSDAQLNDHHFHYGYFIRAAAEVARLDPVWAEAWGPMVELLIRDIASTDRGDPMFPYLRCFDKYAGHSWASGDANFADGNNQESSSESMNAWYGMVLWGEATGNRAMRDAGVFLFNTERTAVEEYWFDVDDTNYPETYPNVALGMVWGGKGAFATWFSADIDCIHGINWLPFTPAALYMGRHPGYVRRNHGKIVEVRRSGRDYSTGWGDLVCMFNALADPASSVAYLDEKPACKLEPGNTHAFMYHWVQTLERLGLNDTGVTADHPLTGVFERDGKRTYAVYNGGGEALEVSFSDGKMVQAAAGGMTVE